MAGERPAIRTPRGSKPLTCVLHSDRSQRVGMKRKKANKLMRARSIRAEEQSMGMKKGWSGLELQHRRRVRGGVARSDLDIPPNASFQAKDLSGPRGSTPHNGHHINRLVPSRRGRPLETTPSKGQNSRQMLSKRKAIESQSIRLTIIGAPI